MQATARHREAEAQFRELIDQEGLAPPDDMEVAPDELVFYWYAPKVAIIVELETPDLAA